MLILYAVTDFFVGVVLVVDDNNNTTEAVKSVLEIAGHKCYTANSGKECLVLLKKRSFDLMLLDLEMPGLSGVDLLEKLTEDSTMIHTKIVFFTASPTFTEKDIDELKKKYVVSDHLTKPFTTAELLAVVEKYTR